MRSIVSSSAGVMAGNISVAIVIQIATMTGLDPESTIFSAVITWFVVSFLVWRVTRYFVGSNDQAGVE